MQTLPPLRRAAACPPCPSGATCAGGKCVATRPVPATPANISAAPGIRCAVVRWDSAARASSYSVEASEPAGWRFVSTTSDLFALVTGLPEAEDVELRVV